MFLTCYMYVFRSIEAFNTTALNRLTGEPSKASLLFVYCKPPQLHTFSLTQNTYNKCWNLWVEACEFITLFLYTETWAEMKSELSTEMLFSPSVHSQICEYDFCVMCSLYHELHSNWSIFFKILICFLRDLSMNSLTMIPTTGLSALSQLKLSGNPQMKNVLTGNNLPKLRWGNTFVVCCHIYLDQTTG